MNTTIFEMIWRHLERFNGRFLLLRKSGGHVLDLSLAYRLSAIIGVILSAAVLILSAGFLPEGKHKIMRGF